MSCYFSNDAKGQLTPLKAGQKLKILAEYGSSRGKESVTLASGLLMEDPK